MIKPTEKLSPEVIAWAETKMKDDADYIRRAAKIGTPLVQQIANLILEIHNNKNRGKVSV